MDAENNFIENLIENVKKQRCLYDKRDGFYYNRNVKEKAWKEVSEKCIKSVEDCKHRWKLLRERFGKEIKKMEAPLGSGMYYLDEWKFLQPLMFLKDSIAPRRTRDNVEDQDVELVLDHSIFSADSLQDSPPPTASAGKKAKLSLDSLFQKFGETIEKLGSSFSSTPEGSPLDDAFLNTVSCLMKELPEPLKEEFQSRMLQELYRLWRENKH